MRTCCYNSNQSQRTRRPIIDIRNRGSVSLEELGELKSAENRPSPAILIERDGRIDAYKNAKNAEKYYNISV